MMSLDATPSFVDICPILLILLAVISFTVPNASDISPAIFEASCPVPININDAALIDGWRAAVWPNEVPNSCAKLTVCFK